MREYTAMYCHNKKLTPNAKILRKNMTAEERRLWYGFLRTYRPRFLRQKVIGNYIVLLISTAPRPSLLLSLTGHSILKKQALKMI